MIKFFVSVFVSLQGWRSNKNYKEPDFFLGGELIYIFLFVCFSHEYLILDCNIDNARLTQRSFDVTVDFQIAKYTVWDPKSRLIDWFYGMLTR